MIIRSAAITLMGLIGFAAFASDDVSNESPTMTNDNMLMADNPRKDRRDDRQEDRDGKQDCRQEEGRIGDDKRECKQEEHQEGDDGKELDDDDGNEPEAESEA
jgi:hypothetical protein